jgi:EAL domain-containing protein (putative c-di-GMP-specific phosphodiesterase class I)
MPTFTCLAIEKEREAGEIIRTIMSLAKSLQMDVVAEGIETETQRRLLHDWECLYAQGFLFSRPLPPDEVDQWLRQWPH